MQACKKVLVALVSLIGTLVALALTGVLAQLLGWTLFVAAVGDEVMTKHLILFGWTLGSMVLAFISKVTVLFRSRKLHHLAWNEYIKHGMVSGVLAGALAYGTVNVITTGFNAITTDVEMADDLNRESAIDIMRLALIPTFVTMLAAAITVHNNIVETPASDRTTIR